MNISHYTLSTRSAIALVLLIFSPLSAREKKRKQRPKKVTNISKFTWHHKGATTETTQGKHVGLVETPGIKPLGYHLDGDTKVFRLTAQPIVQTLTDGKPTHLQLELAMNNILGIRHLSKKQTLKAWGYNGSSPGPTIELTEGDHVRIIFKNELPEPTLVRWHGIEHPHELDKSSDRNPVMPGQVHIYEFTVHTPGTYLYHSGCSIFKQNRYGLVGMIVVHPKSYDTKIDRHIALLLQDWSLGTSNTPNTVTSHMNWFTINGHAAPSIPRIVLKQHERVRFHLGSLALDPYPLQIHGHTWSLVGTEGGLIRPSAQINYATLTMNPCTTRTIEFEAWNPGVWPFYALTTHHCSPVEVSSHGGMFTLIEVVPEDPEAEWCHPSKR